MEKSPKELAEEKLKRIEDAVNLKEPDKVPLELHFDFGFMAKWTGITTYEFLFNYDKAIHVIRKTALDFQRDVPPLTLIGTGSLLGFALRDYPDVSPYIGALTGPMHDILRDRYTRWPGRELSPETGSFQFIGGEFLKQDEYDKFIDNPIEFMAEVVVPRAHASLEKPGSPEAMATLIKAALEGVKYADYINKVSDELTNIGYPLLLTGITSVPLDFLGDFLRTIPGILLDLRKVPEKVKLACEVLMEKTVLERILSFQSLKYMLIPLHLNEYLSPKLYDEFYWSYLKKIIVELNKKGIKCQVAFEGRHDAHLERILELPKAWGIALFEKTDVRKAKKLLDGHTCVMGGIPPTFLLNATPKKVEDYVKKLLTDVMPGGGFILTSSTAIPTQVPPENVKAIIRAVEKYGIYRR